MKIEDLKNLSKVRIEHAKVDLFAAEQLLKVEVYKAAANRSYYAIFHAMRAVLALNGIDRSKHIGVISEFRRLYIKTKIFSKEISNIITLLFYVRTESDYNDFYIISKKEVKQQIENAKFFIKEVEKYLKTKYKTLKTQQRLK